MNMKTLFVTIAVLLSGGCTCLTQFDPDSQPCELNAPAAQRCAGNYECVSTSPDAGVCRRIPDAGQ